MSDNGAGKLSGFTRDSMIENHKHYGKSPLYETTLYQADSDDDVSLLSIRSSKTLTSGGCCQNNIIKYFFGVLILSCMTIMLIMIFLFNFPFVSIGVLVPFLGILIGILSLSISLLVSHSTLFQKKNKSQLNTEEE